MTRLLAIALVILCAAAMIAAQVPAQERPTSDQPTAQQPSTQQPPIQPSQATAANKVTYTGCLKPGATAGTWTLENAEMASAAGTPAKPSQTPAGTSGVAGAKGIFNLSAKPGDDLKPHANHKIEVVGTMSQAGTPGTASGAAPSAASAVPRQTLNVESFKMISAKCP